MVFRVSSLLGVVEDATDMKLLWLNHIKLSPPHVNAVLSVGESSSWWSSFRVTVLRFKQFIRPVCCWWAPSAPANPASSIPSTLCFEATWHVRPSRGRATGVWPLRCLCKSGLRLQQYLTPWVLTEQIVPLSDLACLSCSSAPTPSKRGKVVELCLWSCVTQWG